MNALETARALRAEAVFHKREAEQHRRKSRQLMEQMRQICEAAGIDIEYVVVQGGQGHGIRSQQVRD